MAWEKIKENKVIKFIKNHWIYFISVGTWGMFVSNMLSSPIINTILLLIAITSSSIIAVDFIFVSKICRWIAYIIVSVVCISGGVWNWDKLIYVLDRDNPYKKPLQTGTASVEIIIDSNTTNSSNCYAGDCASILLSGDGPEVYFVMTSQNSIYTRSNKKNEATCWATAFNLPAVNDSIGKPISCLSEAKSAQIFFKELGNQTIKRGSLIFVFNSSVRVEITIQPQTINYFTGVYIPDIGKYFKKGK